MRYKLAIPLLIAAFFFFAGFWAGCIVDDGVLEEGGYPCTSDDDCIELYECDCGGDGCEGDAQGTCVSVTNDNNGDSPPCEDADGDGYGDKDQSDRGDCEHPEKDCHDGDPNVYPGAPQLCDGQANDCNEWCDAATFDECDDVEEPPGGAVDDFSCDSSCDVPEEYSSGFSSLCDDGTCILVPQNENDEACEEDEINITCNTERREFTWDRDGEEVSIEEVPGECT